MLQNKRMIKLLCLALALCLSLSLLGGCKKKNPDVGSSEQTEQHAPTDSVDSNEPTEELIEEEPSEEEPSTEPEEDYTEETPIYDLHVYNAQKPVQTHYRGISSTVYHAFGYMKDDKSGRAYTDDMLKIELDRLQDTGIHFCRTRFDTRWIWSGTKGNWDFNTARANYFYDYCNALQDRGMEVILSVGWHFSALLENEQSGIPEADYLMGNNDNINGEGIGFDYSGMDAEDIRFANAALRYGDAYAKLLKELKSRGIHNISHLLYFTESCSYSYSADPAEGQKQRYKDYARYLTCSQIIKKTLEKNGVGDWAKHMGPNQSSPTAQMMQYIFERDTEVFDVWGSHTYPAGQSITSNLYYDLYQPIWAAYMQPMKDYGLYDDAEFWIDEFQTRDQTFAVGKPDNTPWVGLQGVVGAIAAAQEGVSNISTWQSFDQLWTDQNNSSGEFLNGIHMCGHAPSLFMSSIPRGPYYMYGLYGKYNGYEGGTIYKTNLEDWYWDAGLYINANKLADGNWTITVVNAEMYDATFTVDFEKAIGKTLYRHTENANDLQPDAYAELATVDKVYVDVEDKFIDTLPGGTVAVYTTIKG